MGNGWSAYRSAYLPDWSTDASARAARVAHTAGAARAAHMSAGMLSEGARGHRAKERERSQDGPGNPVKAKPTRDGCFHNSLPGSVGRRRED